METKFLKEALFNGMTSNAFKLGTVLTLGWFWVRLLRCYCIYRGQDSNIVEEVQATVKLEDTQISIAHQNLLPNTIWQFIRRQVSCCGLESENSSICNVVIDANGDMIDITPNPPQNLIIENLINGKLKLRWQYTSDEQEIAPTGFKIYMDSGNGFDFDNPEATVSYDLGWTGEFSWISEPLTHGQLYRFCVRSYYIDGGETQNTNFVAAIADAEGPAAITGLRVNWQEI